MAQILRASKTKKRWKHLRMRLRNGIFRISIVFNVLLGIYIYEPDIANKLTDIIERVAPLLESLIQQLPL